MFNLYYTIMDDKGQTSKVTIPFPDSLGIANVPAAVQAIGDLLDPLISGGMMSAGFSYDVDISGFGWNASPILYIDVQEGAKFVFRGVNGFLKRLRLPCFKENKMLPNSNKVDQTDTDVAAFATAMVDGVDLTSYGGTGTHAASDVRGDDLTSLQDAYESFTRNRG